MQTLSPPARCPACSGRLQITGLRCPDCHTEVKGTFWPNEFALLTPEHLEFLRLYLKVRGNLKEVERILGLSYPTVRARLEGLLRALGYEEESQVEKEEILSRLERGQISAAEAAERLRALRKR
ncbi:MAG: DUF2089 domain-containing protein [Meiothermus sp.]|uniref:DUF2089 domain-containing protein n=1 Tax=Meiothermus sp. TaxID=1955249 RepID=UPI0025FDCB0A|nr:DUF2089 domain-containing protein [Meiothermus sp.]MCS7058904.1 DUF2089 domain-containing protein [Meiothermus sp.]MCS7195075.1 DUF2089 domain-containing protein [Meiothermus sp.]MCX7740418.1 DUF2089 domain-containing protein [Meiothermus sp.]MDW8090131.1 DUF2089 domain-containing protein [Meiothermus sp.]